MSFPRPQPRWPGRTSADGLGRGCPRSEAEPRGEGARHREPGGPAPFQAVRTLRGETGRRARTVGVCVPAAGALPGGSEGPASPPAAGPWPHAPSASLLLPHLLPRAASQPSERSLGGAPSEPAPAEEECRGSAGLWAGLLDPGPRSRGQACLLTQRNKGLQERPPAVRWSGDLSSSVPLRQAFTPDRELLSGPVLGPADPHTVSHTWGFPAEKGQGHLGFRARQPTWGNGGCTAPAKGEAAPPQG